MATKQWRTDLPLDQKLEIVSLTSQAEPSTSRHSKCLQSMMLKIVKNKDAIMGEVKAWLYRWKARHRIKFKRHRKKKMVKCYVIICNIAACVLEYSTKNLSALSKNLSALSPALSPHALISALSDACMPIGIYIFHCHNVCFGLALRLAGWSCALTGMLLGSCFHNSRLGQTWSLSRSWKDCSI